MAAEPDNLVLSLLRDMRAVQHEQSRRLIHIEGRVDQTHESMITGLGLPAHANIRHDIVEERLRDLSDRVERLEGKP
ncbi:hypothetical protein [Methylobacterium aquaticum]|jgi:hypothetical protein|uniref:Uncharacterized protein n=1 Tax=Methylobacterium aquaticum TaxID=270351 RepID=A0A0J6T0N2_9HYPH|nr:hypothetical protein [Methylobacterium aquaticum]KMO39534.1 hypothetical protein VP06_04010 [Methylobacterium aquaticum]